MWCSTQKAHCIQARERQTDRQKERKGEGERENEREREKEREREREKERERERTQNSVLYYLRIEILGNSLFLQSVLAKLHRQHI